MVLVSNHVSADILKRLATFRETLDRSLPGLVSQVILFGSQARQDARCDSDYDLAVLIRRDTADCTSVRDAVADATLPHLMDGYCFTALPLADDYLDKVDGHYRTELARRIAAEGLEI